MMFRVPEKYRLKSGPMASTFSEDGNNGVFIVPLSNVTTMIVIASDGMGWEHVSARCMDVDPFKKIVRERTPIWDEMCTIKEIFWTEEDCVVQYHPRKSEYVNNHPNVLHLWRPIDATIPTPPSILVGIKNP